LARLFTGAAVQLVFEHTGSTAVPGLAAKPIIDILGGFAVEDQRSAAIATLQAAGYVHRGEQEIPGRDFFRRGTPRQYHLHLTRVGSHFWLDHMQFREWLRAHADTAHRYAALKRELAERYPTDREAYINGKTAFVAEALRSARIGRES
jgi:GrpB-like predicted nucleotidyltransferase (UPF0157 family)